ncbi:glycosyltransferase [Acinetobacter baumannii]|uniref:glycosyltransferase n=1 Tax=Acinetobacter calcoaceticus/baumannii complex TaxID=909768 RepID=UPI001022F6F3|nr:glycosyltransferase [Acinetobacter pittii]RZH08324.1 glycosyltransferase family 1 protein [Acinetobacter pittii]
MKILLIGEYSGAYTLLSKKLRQEGHSVVWVHDGDAYKKFSGADFNIKYSEIEAPSLFLKIFYILLDFLGVKGIFAIRKYKKNINTLRDFDVVQIINTKPLGEFGSYANIYFLKKIFNQNKRVYVSALGDDYIWVKNCLDKKVKYSMFDRLNFKNFYRFSWALLYVYGIGYKKLNEFVFENSIKIIPGLFDYYYAYQSQGVSKCSDLVPLIVEPKVNNSVNFFSEKINIFHGWQHNKELRKGNDIFDRAIKRLQNKYPLKVNYEIVSGLPYNEYIDKFSDAHIFIDQCFSLDQGVNGLLGMAAGKVVFSGYSEELRMYLKEDKSEYLINALPNEDYIFEKLENLLNNPNEMVKISNNAIKYIEKYHNPDVIYRQLMNIWLNN